MARASCKYNHECTPEEFRALLKSMGFEPEGWIDEKGNFWPCDQHMLHGFIAAAVLDLGEADAEKEADRRGWLRISNYGDRIAAKQLNAAQRDTYFDYCQHFKLDYRETLQTIEFLS
jgi:hypothetical protein